VDFSQKGAKTVSANRAALLQSVKKPQPKRIPKPNRTINLLIAKRPAGDRIERLVDLASSLLEETTSLAQDKRFTDESSRFKSLDMSTGIDFYDQVKRFETSLIKLALEKTGGNQARAAELLGLKTTTLNSKIKLYNIEY
jgi:DNA-binding protein Fis